MTEPKFRPIDNKIDFTNARYTPVINCVIEHEGKILVVKRSKTMNFYPDVWNGISGFLDDKGSVEDKVKEELLEELGIKADQIQQIAQAPVLIQEAPDINRTWIVFPVHVNVKTNKYKLDWEASEAKWLSLTEARELKLLPGFDEVLDTIFGSY